MNGREQTQELHLRGHATTNLGTFSMNGWGQTQELRFSKVPYACALFYLDVNDDGLEWLRRNVRSGTMTCRRSFGLSSGYSVVLVIQRCVSASKVSQFVALPATRPLPLRNLTISGPQLGPNRGPNPNGGLVDCGPCDSPYGSSRKANGSVGHHMSLSLEPNVSVTLAHKNRPRVKACAKCAARYIVTCGVVLCSHKFRATAG